MDCNSEAGRPGLGGVGLGGDGLVRVVLRFWDLTGDKEDSISAEDIPDTGDGVPGPAFTEFVGVGDNEEIGEHLVFLGGDWEISNISSSDDMT